MNKRKKIPKKMEELLEYVNRHWGKTQKCHHCKGEPQGVCQSCMSLVYCGSTCQTKDWERGHFESCYIAGRGREDEEPEERVKARRTEEGRVEEREYLEVIDLSAFPKDVLNRIADFLSGRDIRNLRETSRLIEERIRLAYFSKFRFRLTPEVLRSPIAPYIQVVMDPSGGRFSRQLVMLQERSFLKNIMVWGDIDWDSILNLRDVNHLNLSWDQIDGLPREIGNLISLQKLNLSNNRLREIPRELGHLSNLEIFGLGHNRLTEIPRELGNLSNLQELGLGQNRLTGIPKELGNLSNLQELWLDNNRMTEIPRELGDLNKLQILDLSWNQLTKIPKELGNLIKLQVLDLSSNQLSEIPRELGHATNLRDFYVSQNRLTEIPRELGNLTNLRELWLHDNQLSDIENAKILAFMPPTTRIHF